MDALEALAAASRCDLDAYSKPQLRQLVAKAHELAARATNEIDARGCAFPARLAPLVTQWLPLEDVGAALSSNKQWQATSEWAFQLVAARSGVAGAAGVPWRDIVKADVAPCWTGEVLDRDTGRIVALAPNGAPDGEPTDGRELMMRGAKITGGEDDSYLVARGTPLRLGRRRAWRVHMTRSTEHHVVDAVGFVITDPAQREILLEYHVNSSGGQYNRNDQQWSREIQLFECDEDGETEEEDLWAHDAQLELSVELAGEKFQREIAVVLADAEGRAIVGGTIDAAWTNDIFRAQFMDFARRCGWNDFRVALEDLCVAPFVRIYHDSTATVLRATSPANASPPRFSFPNGIGEE
jgi:hypothetical protein